MSRFVGRLLNCSVFIVFSKSTESLALAGTALVLFLFPFHSNAQIDNNFFNGGGIRVGDSTTACAGNGGGIRFDADSSDGGGLQYCDGTSWLDILTGTITGDVSQGGNSFAAPMIIGTNDNNTLAFETNGSTRMTIDTSGNVGIGTTTPAVELDVNTGTINAASICDENNANCLDLSAGMSGGDPSYGSSASSPNDAVYVDDSGNVGIGTTAPLVALHVLGPIRGVNGSNSVIIEDGAGNTAFRGVNSGAYSPNLSSQWFQIGNTNDSVIFSAENGSRMQRLQYRSQSTLFNASNAPWTTTPAPDGIFQIMNSSQAKVVTVLDNGNVGVGTTTPGEKFVVSDGTSDVFRVDTTNGHVEVRSRFLSAGNGAGVFSIRGGSTNGGGIDINNTEMTFHTNVGNERMRIDSSGNVGIGTTTPGAELDVIGTIRAQQICDEDGSDCIDLSAGISGGDPSYGSSASSPTDAVFVNDSGNLGIATLTPQAKLDVAGGAIFRSGPLLMPTHLGTTSDVQMSSASGSTTLTFSHTVTGGNNRLLLVGVAIDSVTESVFSVEFDSVPLTKLTDHTTESQITGELWYLLNPPTITADVEVVLDSGERFGAAAMNFENVNQTTPFSSLSNTNSPDGNSTSTTVASGPNNVVFDMAFINSFSAITPDVSQTGLWSENSLSGTLSVTASIKTGAVSTTMQHTWPSGSRIAGHIAFEINNVSLTSPGPLVETMRITDSGEVGIGTNAPTHILHIAGPGRSTQSTWDTTSDGRLKNILGDYEYGLDEIRQLQTRWFRYKSDNPYSLPDDQEFMGVVAQELMQVIPEAVREDQNGYYTVNTDPILWALVNASGELESRLKQMEAENRQLRQELDEIKKMLQTRPTN